MEKRRRSLLCSSGGGFRVGTRTCLAGIVALIVTLALAPLATRGFAQTSPNRKTVNIELIVDSSGSMGAATDTGERRINAAKSVLTRVNSEIPTVDGVNIGFRVYGHRGDNTDAGRAESCASSELLVPMNGVDVPALTAQVNALQPVGWTPLAYSLQQAAADFTMAATDDVVNAIVMVTDGLETCDGDPVSVARFLRNSPAAITTHVIGFGTTEEEQAILQGTADAGGGQLLGAANAGELTSALFDVLDQLEVVQGVGFIGGNALDLVPQGPPGELAAVATGRYDGNMLPIVVRNNTGHDVIRITASVSARNADGQLIGSGSDQTFHPNLVRSGGVSIGYAYFGGVAFPEGTTFDVELESSPASDDEFENARDLNVVEASTIDGRVVGTLANGYDTHLDGPFSVAAVCFDESSTVLSVLQSFASKERLAPDETVTFQIDNYSGAPCPLFLVAGSGWDNSFGPNNDVEPPTSTEQPIEVGGASTVAAQPTAPAGPPSSATLANPGGCPDLGSAEAILLALQAAGLPIGEYEVYTAETDPNQLLGRPLQYIAKVNFRDTRLPSNPVDLGSTDGGTIEVFSTTEDAQARSDYVTSVIRQHPEFAQYLYLEGTILIRVAGALTPDQASPYSAALDSIVACSP